jgi:hypothetical protein
LFYSHAHPFRCLYPQYLSLRPYPQYLSLLSLSAIPRRERERHQRQLDFKAYVERKAAGGSGGGASGGAGDSLLEMLGIA